MGGGGGGDGKGGEETELASCLDPEVVSAFVPGGRVESAIQDLAIEHHYTKYIVDSGTPIRLRIIDSFPSRLASPLALLDLLEEVGVFHGVVLAYDMGSKATLETLRTFVMGFPLDTLPMVPYTALVATKADDEDRRAVTQELASEWAREYFGGAETYEVSAKEDPDAVAAVFEDLVRRIRDDRPVARDPSACSIS